MKLDFTTSLLTKSFSFLPPFHLPPQRKRRALCLHRHHPHHLRLCVSLLSVSTRVCNLSPCVSATDQHVFNGRIHFLILQRALGQEESRYTFLSLVKGCEEEEEEGKRNRGKFKVTHATKKEMRFRRKILLFAARGKKM